MRNPKFDTLFISHYHRVYRQVYRIVKSEQEAEDLVQEVFLRLYNHLDEIKLEHVHSWLHRVAINLSLNAIRNRKRLHNWQQKAMDIKRDGGDVARMNIADDSLVRHCLALLPERQAQLLLLHAAGFSYEELALATGIQKTSVSRLLMRARQAFRKLYNKEALR